MRREPVFSTDFEAFAGRQGYDPHAHHEVLRYFRKLWAGEPRDAAFESRSLSGDLRFRLLNLAELVVAMADEIGLPADRAVEFLSISAGPQPLEEGVLAGRVLALRRTAAEEERARTLLTGPATRGSALRSLKGPIDQVGRLTRYCAAIEKYCRTSGAPRFPAPDPSGAAAPDHMRTRAAKDVAAYRKRRAALGAPWEEPAASAVAKFVAYETGAADVTRDTELEGDLGLDVLGIVFLLMQLEDHYDGRVRFGDDFEPSTVGDLVVAVESRLRTAK